MFPLTFEVKVTGLLTARAQRDFDRKVKLSLRAMLVYWFVKHFPKHFTPQAFFRYGDVYRRRRTKKPRDPRPLVETGRLKRELEASFRVMGSGKLMRAIMRGPKYLLARGKGQPDKPAEISHVNKSEERELAGVFRDTLVHLLNSDASTETTRIGR